MMCVTRLVQCNYTHFDIEYPIVILIIKSSIVGFNGCHSKDLSLTHLLNIYILVMLMHVVRDMDD